MSTPINKILNMLSYSVVYLLKRQNYYTSAATDIFLGNL